MKKVVGWMLILVCTLCGVFTLTGCKKMSDAHTRYEIIAEYMPETRTLTATEKVTFEK